MPGFHTYVDAPVAVIEVLDPLQMVAFVVVVATVGSAFTVITTVELLLPLPFVAVCVTVYVPAVFHTTPVTFCVVAVPGDPLGNVQLHEVGLPVDASVKFTGVPAQTVVALAVKADVGGRLAGVPEMLMLSI